MVRPGDPTAVTRTAAWAPRADVFERNGNLVIKAELPGLKKEDIQVTFDNGNLTIQGERKEESEVKDEDYYRCERSYGSFFRRMTLPPGTEADKITATYADGVLEVQVPKAAETKPEAKKISVS
jgi:HSP20 family protein